jgi:hypothetical protein
MPTPTPLKVHLGKAEPQLKNGYLIGEKYIAFCGFSRAEQPLLTWDIELVDCKGCIKKHYSEILKENAPQIDR